MSLGHDDVDWTETPTRVYRSSSNRPAPTERSYDLDAVFERAQARGATLEAEFIYNVYVQASAELLRVSEARKGEYQAGELRPDKIHLSADGYVKLQLSPSDGAAPSERSSPVGRSYRAPECLQGRAADTRADVFSLGLCIAELLFLKRLSSGAETVFTTEGGADLVAALRKGSRPVRELARVAGQSLVRDPERRYGDFAALLSDLRQVGKKLGFGVGAPMVAAALKPLFPDFEITPSPPSAPRSPSIAPPPPKLPPREPPNQVDLFAALAAAPPATAQVLPPRSPAAASPASTVPPPPRHPTTQASGAPRSSAPPPPPRPASAPPPVGSLHQSVSGPLPLPAPVPGFASAPPGSPVGPVPAGVPRAWGQSSEAGPRAAEVPLPLARGVQPGRVPWGDGGQVLADLVARWKMLSPRWKIGLAAAACAVLLVPFLSGNSGTVYVAVGTTFGQTPPGIVAVVDGTKRCALPRCTFDLSPGMHELSAQADGFVPQNQIVVVRAHDQLAINVRLERAMSSVRVSAQPDGALLFVDGEQVGRVPMRVDLAPGPHKFRFEAKDFLPEERQIDVGVGQNRTLADVSLRAAVGRATFEIRPSGADLALESENERREHIEAGRPIELDRSKHWVLEARKLGYQTLRETLEWDSAPDKTFAFTLARPDGAFGPQAPVAVRPESPRSRAQAPRPSLASTEASQSSPEPAQEAAPAPAPARAASTEACSLSFNSIPASNVFLDSVRLGMTPLVKVSARAGSHVVQFAQGDLKRSKPFACDPGEYKIVAVNLAR